MFVTDSIENAARRFLRELPADTRRNSVIIDDDGQAHVKGGIFNATGGRDVSLSMHGLSAGDVAAFRKELRTTTGITLSQEAADQLLAEAAYATIVPVDEDEKRRKNREKIARRREWARANGYCIICTKNAASFKTDGTQNATCSECQRKANAAKKARKP